MKANPKKLTIGILAHVDAGKTTLSEAILYKTGVIRKLGRVDHGQAFLDFDVQEKDRGITIFAGQAEFTLPAVGGPMESGTGGGFAAGKSVATPCNAADGPASCGAASNSAASPCGAANGSLAGSTNGAVVTQCDAPAEVILLDTPGHVDFSAEMERTLSVLDYAVLVISGKEGVQGHTATLWKLLERYNIPIFIFVNKMDLAGTDRQAILSILNTRLASGCFDFSQGAPGGDSSQGETSSISHGAASGDSLSGDLAGGDSSDGDLTGGDSSNGDLTGGDFLSVTNMLEEVAMCDDALLEEFLEKGTFSKLALAKAIKTRKIFPCYFGSALKLEGVDELLHGLSSLTLGYEAGAIQTTGGIKAASTDDLRVRIFRITRDKQGERLTHLKILSGTLHTRDTLGPQHIVVSDSMSTADSGEKINQIRIYSGDKFRTVDEAGAGSLCAVTGPANTQASGESALEAVMTYDVILPEGANVHDTYAKLKQLEEEDPQLQIEWNEQLQELQVKLMGKVQREVLQEIIKARFDLDVDFSDGRIAYKETIAKPTLGAGHYEPLRHYAEVHLLLEPLPAGNGLVLDSKVSEDVLDRNWQRLITTHLLERQHPGTLTGSPITDLKITIVAGRAHDKHTEGGDFRQATYRAIRQALRKSLARGEVILLEPWYEFVLEVPQDMIGRAMADIQRMGGTFDAPSVGGTFDAPRAGGHSNTSRTFGTSDASVVSNAQGETATLKGKAPVSEMKDYVTEVAAYTKGYGHLSCNLAGFEPCHNQDEVCEGIAYEADRDVANPADSVFCSHGAGHNVDWDKADEMMHIPPQKLQSNSGVPGGGVAVAGGLGGMAGGGVAGGGVSVAGGLGGMAGGGEVSVSGGAGGLDNDKELQRIFDRTFTSGGGKNSSGRKASGVRTPDGKKVSIEARQFDSELERRKKDAERRRRANEEAKKRSLRDLPEFLLVDGYNIVFAWDELKELAKVNIDSAREALIDILNNYQGYRKCHVVVVFDAYRVKGGQRHTEKQGNITVVYTAEAETADTYIEKTTYELAGKGRAGGGGKATDARSMIGAAGAGIGAAGAGIARTNEACTGSPGRAGYRVRVATSDRLEQIIIMGNDAARVSADEFKAEVEQVDKEIADFLKKLNRQSEIEGKNHLEI